MTHRIEVNADALTACASVFAGVNLGLFDRDDYTAIWESLPDETRNYVLGIVAAGRIEMEDNA
ncbi:MAG TPA: hypothetical protein VLU46_08500 [Thermoanaerobaculia bacterium]|nr:hypothetical protein [Thermoanaerobaculia bacterium]